MRECNQSEDNESFLGLEVTGVAYMGEEVAVPTDNFLILYQGSVKLHQEPAVRPLNVMTTLQPLQTFDGDPTQSPEVKTLKTEARKEQERVYRLP